MNPNDTVVLRFGHEGEPERHDAEWGHVQAIVANLHSLLEYTLGTVFTPTARPGFKSILVESPRRGSLELIFQFPLVETVRFDTASAKHFLEMAKDGIGLTSDLAGIGSFILALVMCRHGLVAEGSRQAEPPPDNPVDKFIADQAKRLSLSAANELRGLMNAAYASGMAVDVEYRDYGRVRINPASYRRRGNFIGQHRGRQIEDLGNEIEVVVDGKEGPVIRFNEQRYRSVLGRLKNGKPIVLMSFENRPLPKGSLTARGGLIPNSLELHPEQDLPDDFGHAEGPFLVSNFAVWQS